jgi:hypothetical protein
MRIGAPLYHNQYDVADAERALLTKLQPSTLLAVNLARIAFATIL